MNQFVKNKLVLIHEQMIIFLNYIKMIITGKIQLYHKIKNNYFYIILTDKKG